MSDNPDTLNPEFYRRLLAFQQLLHDKYGLQTRISSAGRDMKEQAEQWANGNGAPPGHSAHNFGIAADLQPVNMPKGQNFDRTMRRAFAENPSLGLEWGGYYSKYDPIHVGMAGWASNNEALKQWVRSGAGGPVPNLPAAGPPPRQPTLVPVDHNPFQSLPSQGAPLPRPRPGGSGDTLTAADKQADPIQYDPADTLRLYGGLKSLAGMRNPMPSVGFGMSDHGFPSNIPAMGYNPAAAAADKVNTGPAEFAANLSKLLELRRKMDNPDWVAPFNGLETQPAPTAIAQQ